VKVCKKLYPTTVKLTACFSIFGTVDLLEIIRILV